MVLLICLVDMYGRTANGHAAAADYSERYGTRCATGVIQRKRYDKVFTDDEEDDDDYAGHGRRTLVRSRRNRPAAVSDSDSEHREKMLQTPTKSSSSVVLPSSSSSTLQYSHKAEGESSDNETASDASNASSQSRTDSGSDTEAYSEGSGLAKSARTTRSRGKPVVTNGHVENKYSSGIGTKYRTRNQGRRTVHYEEADSDVDNDVREGRRTLERRRREIGSRARLCRS